MTVKEIFGLIVRAIGLWAVFRGVTEALAALEYAFGVVAANGPYSAGRYAASAVIYSAVGAIMIVAAGRITRLIYGRD